MFWGFESEMDFIFQGFPKILNDDRNLLIPFYDNTFYRIQIS